MKKWFRNSASGRVGVLCGLRSGADGKGIVNPGDRQVMSIAELVAMTNRGQDINSFVRPLLKGMVSDDPDALHDMVSLEDFSNMDFSERREFALDHAERVRGLKREIETLSEVQPPAGGASVPGLPEADERSEEVVGAGTAAPRRSGGAKPPKGESSRGGPPLEEGE